MNAAFHVGDATALPFGDNYFDVVHCHTVLTHVPDTLATLAEARRVLEARRSHGQPGTDHRIVVHGTRSRTPLRGVGNLHEAPRSPIAAILQMGKELKSWHVEAGFTNVRASASFDVFSSAEDVLFLHNFVSGWFFSPDTVAAALKHGLATQEQFDAWRRDLDKWEDAPGAFGCLAFGECLGTNP